jgi:hypothetical protein
MTEKETQDRLLMLNRKGSTIRLFEDDGSVLFETVVDSYLVTRATDDAFWLLWKAVWYDDDAHYAHTMKVVEYEIEDTLKHDFEGLQWVAIRMTDDRGRKYLVELIEPKSQPEQQAVWKQWTTYRNENKEALARIDEALLKDHQVMAEGWR